MKRTFSIFAFVSLTVLFISVGAAETKLQRGPQGFSVAQNSQNIKIDAEYGKMPLYFIPNQGQIDNLFHAMWDYFCADPGAKI
jgi:hypothetical protein